MVSSKKKKKKKKEHFLSDVLDHQLCMNTSLTSLHPIFLLSICVPETPAFFLHEYNNSSLLLIVFAYCLLYFSIDDKCVFHRKEGCDRKVLEGQSSVLLKFFFKCSNDSIITIMYPYCPLFIHLYTYLLHVVHNVNGALLLSVQTQENVCSFGDAASKR